MWMFSNVHACLTIHILLLNCFDNEFSRLFVLFSFYLELVNWIVFHEVKIFSFSLWIFFYLLYIYIILYIYIYIYSCIYTYMMYIYIYIYSYELYIWLNLAVWVYLVKWTFEVQLDYNFRHINITAIMINHLKTKILPYMNNTVEYV